MELGTTEENFFKVLKILVGPVAMHLRVLFMTLWNSMFPSTQWTNDPKSGQHLFNAIPVCVKTKAGHLRNLHYERNILAGDCGL